MNQRLKPIAFAVAMFACVVPSTFAQEARERLLAQGWAELAAGRTRPAADAAATILKESPRDHDAASLSVASALMGSGSLSALTTYEHWLTSSRREDPYLLEDIASAELRALSKANDPKINFAALSLLARRGDASARAQLSALASEPSLPLEAEAELARAGDPVGVQRLKDRITGGGAGDKSYAIRALQESGQPGIAAVIAEGLKDPSPTSRIAAAAALADLRATDALPQLRAAVADPEPAVRTMVEIALGALGDPQGRERLAGLASSPVPDFRLIAARQSAGRNPQGDWASIVEPLLRDADPFVRLRATELMLAHGRFELVEPGLSAALSEPAAPVRTAAARLLVSVPPDGRGLALIRRMLRDAVPEIRLEAARALVARR